MTESSSADPAVRASRAALLLLAAAVALGVLFLGAPPRFSAGQSGPEWLREFLTSLAPLTILEMSVALAFAGLVAAECLRRESPALPGGRVAARTRLPLVLLLVLGLLQLVPLPETVLGIVAPFSARTYASLMASGDDTMRPASLWTAGTVHALFNVAGVIAVSAAVWTLVRRTDARRVATWVLAFVVIVAAAESAHGLVATRLGDDRLLGVFEKVSGKGRVTGTFIHGTMMAVWAGMGACAALGLAWQAMRRNVAAFAGLLAVAALCALAGFLSLSRLGLLGLIAGGLTTWALLALSIWRDGRRRTAVALWIGALGLVVLVALVALAVTAFRQRIDYLFTSHGIADPRFPMWRSTLALFGEAPVLGTGLGSFGRAIHLTQSTDCPQELWFAHSDPLNLLSDVGIVGFALAAWFVVAMVRRGLPALRAPEASTRCLAAGAFGGAAAVLVASLGDFQTQFLVVSLPFAALLTLPAAMADAMSPPVEDEPRPWLLPARGLAGLVLIAGVTAAAFPVVATIGRLRDLDEYGATGATPAEALVAQAKSLLPHVATAVDPKPLLTQAEIKLREAARLDPLYDEAHLWTGIVALYLAEPQDDVYRALGRTRLVSRGHAQTNLAVGSSYLKLVGTASVPYGPPGDGALPALREASELSPQAFSAAWAMCVERGLPLEELRTIVPDRGHAKIALFDHLRSLGQTGEALEVLKGQLSREPWNEELTTRLAAAYRETGRESEGRAFFDSVHAAWPASAQGN